MQGFDTRALILMPDYYVLEQKGENPLIKLRIGLSGLLDYLDSNYIEAHGIYTDDVMHQVDYESRVKLYNILSREDTYFVYRNCEGMRDIAAAKRWEHPQQETKTSKASDDISPEERFAIISKNEKRLSQLMVKEYKIVFNFVFAGHTNYKVTSNPSDGNIRVYVDAMTLVPEVYLSGERIDACEIFNVGYGNLPLTQWKGKQ